jgi:acyl-CoA dehydrogenase
MDFAYSERVEELRSRLLNFFDEHIHPNDRLYHHQHAEAPDRWFCQLSRQT